MAKSGKTPLMEQYRAIKAQYPDALLFFRMGDFYEMFGDDARVASEILGITLTSRSQGDGERTPLAGVPYHAADQYLAKLLAAGLKVAVCDQMEDPKKAKGLVKREVTELHTPGTITVTIDGDDVDSRYIVSLLPDGHETAIAGADITTGELWTRTIPSEELIDELSAVEPREILLPDNITEELHENLEQNLPTAVRTPYPVWHFEPDEAEKLVKEQLHILELGGFGEITRGEIAAIGALISYIRELKKRSLPHFSRIRKIASAPYLAMDRSTVRNLELVKPIFEENSHATLLATLNHTQTPMGARRIREWILHPLVDVDKIEERLSAVENIMASGGALEDVVETLSDIGDLERLAGRLALQKSSPRDILGIASALEKVPILIAVLKSFATAGFLISIVGRLDPLPDIRKEIERTIVPGAGQLTPTGDIIQNDIIGELDELRDITRNGDCWIRSKEKEMRDKTGIPNLKIGYNKVFGYYIEVTKSYARRVPKDFIRKQTLVGAERYITPELKEMEVKIISARERIWEIQRDYFIRMRARLSLRSAQILSVAHAIGELDTLVSLALVARSGRYARPQFNSDGKIDIREGKHPVVERLLGAKPFVPNDTYLDPVKQQIVILTGPNMAGKSTYLRQVALIVLMAQMGSFVPAESADIAVVDRIFTRVGASDNIAFGQSTFLVEMVETANILHNATPKSLVLLDEIGRGTSTFDGLSLAWAITEYLHQNARHSAKTIFATHYHELTTLARFLGRVANYQVMVRRDGEGVRFLHRIQPGGCDDSYGIEVARLAGVPQEVIARAQQVLSELESESLPSSRVEKIMRFKGKRERVDAYQIDLFEPDAHPLVTELRSVDIDNLTPLQAMQLIAKWREIWGERGRK